jgi:hypothetical protein
MENILKLDYRLGDFSVIRRVRLSLHVLFEKLKARLDHCPESVSPRPRGYL